MKNQMVRIRVLALALIASVFISPVNAQDVNQIRWKNETQVAAILGEPISRRGPVGTHMTYVLWQYEGYVVAFADNMAFHLFRTDSGKDLELEENRSS